MPFLATFYPVITQKDSVFSPNDLGIVAKNVKFTLKFKIKDKFELEIVWKMVYAKSLLSKFNPQEQSHSPLWQHYISDKERGGGYYEQGVYKNNFMKNIHPGERGVLKNCIWMIFLKE